MEATYLFPILEPEQIIETFEGYHIPIKPTQLRNPSAEFIYNVCTQIVLKLTGTTPASLAPVADEEIQAQSFLHPVRFSSHFRPFRHINNTQEIYRASTNKLLMTRQMCVSSSATRRILTCPYVVLVLLVMRTSPTTPPAT
jgi:hypothetical protein